MSSTQPAAPSEHRTTSVTSGVSADHPGVGELFALLAYGEVAAFYRLTEEARMAPNLRGRINLASMAAATGNNSVMPEYFLPRFLSHMLLYGPAHYGCVYGGLLLFVRFHIPVLGIFLDYFSIFVFFYCMFLLFSFYVPFPFSL